MSYVPPAAPMERPKKNNACLWAFLVTLLVCVLAVVGFAIFLASAGRQIGGAMNDGMGVARCSMRMSMTWAAIRAYAEEHGGNLPQAASWQDDIAPYYQRLYNKYGAEFTKVPFVDISVSRPGEPLECVNNANGEKTGIAFNSTLAGQAFASIQNASSTPLLWERPEVVWNNAAPFTELPREEAPKIAGETRDWLEYTVEPTPVNISTRPGTSSSMATTDFDWREALSSPPSGGAAPGLTPGQPVQ